MLHCICNDNFDSADCSFEYPGDYYAGVSSQPSERLRSGGVPHISVPIPHTHLSEE